jgi:hypothetical protein
MRLLAARSAIMRKLARARPGEIHAVIGTQAPDLALEVRALLQEAAGFVDKSVPDIDIGDATLVAVFVLFLVHQWTISSL